MPRPHNQRLRYASRQSSENQNASSDLGHGTSSGTRVPEIQFSNHASDSELHGDDNGPINDIEEADDNGVPVDTRLPVLELLGSDKLWPQDTSHKIGEIVRRKVAPKAYTWSVVPKRLKLEQFNELKKHYTNPDNQKQALFDRFLIVAAGRYKESVHTWKTKRDTEKPEGIDNCDWPNWLAYWDSEPVKNKARKAKENRMTEVDGPGSGIAKYWLGSQSTTVMQYKVKDRGEKMGLYDVFCTGRKTSHGGWKDVKSKTIGEAVEKELVERNEDMTVEEIDEIFFNINRPSKKLRLYGTGSAGLPYVKSKLGGRSSGTNASLPSREEYERHVQQEVQSQVAPMKEQLAALTAILEQHGLMSSQPHQE